MPNETVSPAIRSDRRTGPTKLVTAGGSGSVVSACWAAAMAEAARSLSWRSLQPWAT
ncbi:hypothetical protein FAM14222_001192 [Propionibacterium freudenreichii]|nr:hypothetical protein [Propionibacterium freudenreichii]